MLCLMLSPTEYPWVELSAPDAPNGPCEGYMPAIASPTVRMSMCPESVMLSMGGFGAGSPEAKVVVAFLSCLWRGLSGLLLRRWAKERSVHWVIIEMGCLLCTWGLRVTCSVVEVEDDVRQRGQQMDLRCSLGSSGPFIVLSIHRCKWKACKCTQR